MSLADRACTPCRGDTPPLTADALPPLRAELHDDWAVIEAHHLERTFRFPDFAGALAYVNRVGAIAEEADHHPSIELGWGRVKLEIWTHSIDGLSENDFILAARWDRAFEESGASG